VFNYSVLTTSFENESILNATKYVLLNLFYKNNYIHYILCMHESLGYNNVHLFENTHWKQS